MNAEEMRALSAGELAGKVQSWEEELFRARCEKVVGQLKQTHQIQVLRRNVARAKTILNEKSRHAPE
ncbi:MAG TPA: 50S ribosomal protein L29 [bacterium]|nr:50S ribosomal protein L29 [bacterium]